MDLGGFGGIRRDSAGLGGIRLDSAGFGWILRDSAGFGWIRLDSAGFGGILRYSAGFGWIRLDSAGFGWIRLDSAGFGWIRGDSGGFGYCCRVCACNIILCLGGKRACCVRCGQHARQACTELLYCVQVGACMRHCLHMRNLFTKICSPNDAAGWPYITCFVHFPSLVQNPFALISRHTPPQPPASLSPLRLGEEKKKKKLDNK